MSEYYSSNSNGDLPLEWVDAEAFCVERGGHLASIASHAENTFVSSLEDSLLLQRWIGASRLQSGSIVSPYEW